MDPQIPGIQVETGVELLIRLRVRPSLVHLEKTLFPNGLQSKDVVEISGNVSSGKTLLLMGLFVRTLLPPRYGDVKLNGIGASIIFIDTDHHFKISRLTSMMMSYVRKEIQRSGSKQLDEAGLRCIMEESLSRLTVVTCCESSGFLVSLYALEKMIFDNVNVALVAIDSISSYYWQDRQNDGVWLMGKYIDNYLKTLERYALRQKIALIYTKPDYFKSKNKELPGLPVYSQPKGIAYKIRLYRDDSNQFSATVSSENNEIRLKYHISDVGLVWEL